MQTFGIIVLGALPVILLLWFMVELRAIRSAVEKTERTTQAFWEKWYNR